MKTFAQTILSIGEVSKTDMFKVLSSLNSTASYFGDAVMSRDELDAMVEDVFRSAEVGHTSSLNYTDAMDTMVAHPILTTFVNGGGTVRYGQGK